MGSRVGLLTQPGLLSKAHHSVSTPGKRSAALKNYFGFQDCGAREHKPQAGNKSMPGIFGGRLSASRSEVKPSGKVSKVQQCPEARMIPEKSNCAQITSGIERRIKIC